MDSDETLTVKMRLLLAAKTLFSQNGFEQTSTASIAREAGTSESQLVRYFGTKAGLLEGVFETSWAGLHERVLNATAVAPTAREALTSILGIIHESFSSDPDVGYLLLFEGRRIRGPEHEIFLSRGFKRFSELLHQLILRGVHDGSFSRPLNPAAMASALLGAAEGMMREAMTAQRSGQPEPFSQEDVRQVFTAILDGI